MFCVIQEIETKKPSKGNSKEIEVYESRFTMNGREYCYYRYCKSDECFERPIKKAYRISVHQSYREDGKVRKKQTVICTMHYYDIVDGFSWFGDHIRGSLEAKADALGLTEKELCDMVETKLQPIIDQITAEYEKTEEYAASQEHDCIIREWTEKREAFAKKYGVNQDEYDQIYDVFGTLRNPQRLEKIKNDYKFRKEYEEKSRSYQEDYFNNYKEKFFGGGSGSYSDFSSINYTDENKEMLKQFYRVLSKSSTRTVIRIGTPVQK